MRIAYYISDYGYGHASRSIAIIRRLLKEYPHIEIIICHRFAIVFLKSSIQDHRVSFRNVATDFGYILDADTLEIDSLHLGIALKEQQLNWSALTKREVLFMKKQKIEFVISDISALAIEAADQIGIRSIGISNFLWTDVYKTLVPETMYEYLNEAYTKMSHFLPLEGSLSTKWNHNESDIPFFAREIDWTEVKRIRSRLIKGQKQLIFYGLGMKVNHDVVMPQLNLFNSKDCVFIVSSHIDYEAPNVYRIPQDYEETQHFVAASDFVITKPGWGTIGEALQGKSRLLLLQRDTFLEDATTIQQLQKNNECQTFSLSQLKELTFNKESIAMLKRDIQLRENRNGLNQVMFNLHQILRSD